MIRRFFSLSLVLLLCVSCVEASENMLSFVGDASSYVPVSSCPQSAQIVISEKKFPTDLIHSCASKLKSIDGQDVDLVKISHGAAQDCPAGCIYEGFIGLVIAQGSSIVDLPGDEIFALQNAFSQMALKEQGMVGFTCEANYDLSNFTDITLNRRNGYYGWQLIFHRPYSCQWREITFTRVTYEYKLLNTGYVMSRIFEGNIFVYSKDGNVMWDLSELKRMDRQGKSFENEEIK